MTQYFLDSSALIKRYIVEPGTTWVRSLSNRGPPAHSGNTVIITPNYPNIFWLRGDALGLLAHPAHPPRPGGVAPLFRPPAPRELGLDCKLSMVPRVPWPAFRGAPSTRDGVPLPSGVAQLLSCCFSLLVFLFFCFRLLVAAPIDGLVLDDPGPLPPTPSGAPPPLCFSRHLRQRRFGLGQPEGHVHGAVQGDGGRQGVRGPAPAGRSGRTACPGRGGSGPGAGACRVPRPGPGPAGSGLRPARHREGSAWAWTTPSWCSASASFPRSLCCRARSSAWRACCQASSPCPARRQTSLSHATQEA